MVWTLALRLFQDDSAAPPAAVNSSALAEMIHNSGPVAFTVLILLAFFSVFSWAIMFSKWRSFTKAHTQSQRFLRAFRKATRDYHDAFTAPDGSRKDMAGAPELLAIMAKYTGQTVSQIDDSIGYIDPNAAIDTADVARQVAWYKAQGLVKGDLPGDQLVDMRYAIKLIPSASH